MSQAARLQDFTWIIHILAWGQWYDGDGDGGGGDGGDDGGGGDGGGDGGGGDDEMLRCAQLSYV